jgi:chorismate synthase
MSGAANQFGTRFVLTSFGESHGVGLGVVLDGVPAQVPWNQDLLQQWIERRRPGSSSHVSARSESDAVEVLSGVYENKTLGTPIAMLVRNADAQSQAYKDAAPRKGHADETWLKKFGWSDPRGGGRSSGRETLSRVLAGAVAEMFVLSQGSAPIVKAWIEELGPLSLTEDEKNEAINHLSRSDIDGCVARFPSTTQAQAVSSLLEQAKTSGESYGAKIHLRLEALPAGLGQPVFRKLKADFAAAFFSIGAVVAAELGAGTLSSKVPGTKFHGEKALPYGGIQGGISTGAPMDWNIWVKPTSSILDVAKRGRHDPCIGVRAVPVIEAMAWLVVAEHLLWSREDRA